MYTDKQQHVAERLQVYGIQRVLRGRQVPEAHIQEYVVGVEDTGFEGYPLHSLPNAREVWIDYNIFVGMGGLPDVTPTYEQSHGIVAFDSYEARYLEGLADGMMGDKDWRTREKEEWDPNP